MNVVQSEEMIAKTAYNFVSSVLNLSIEDKYRMTKDALKRVKSALIGLIREARSKGVEEKISEVEEKISEEVLGDLRRFIQQGPEGEEKEKKKIVVEFMRQFQSKYRSYIERIPSMILSSGTGMTFAFISSKKKQGNPYDVIYSHMVDYIAVDLGYPIQTSSGGDVLVGFIISVSSKEYMHITDRILLLFKWLKRFVEGMIREEE